VLENEALLVQQAVLEDTAFEKLYNYYFPQIYGYILKRNTLLKGRLFRLK
jgi:hypothetical protein